MLKYTVLILFLTISLLVSGQTDTTEVGNQTLLLIDGVRLNNSIYRYGPNQYLNTIDAYAIDKIEVAKGTGSV